MVFLISDAPEEPPNEPPDDAKVDAPVEYDHDVVEVEPPPREEVPDLVLRQPDPVFIKDRLRRPHVPTPQSKKVCVPKSPPMPILLLNPSLLVLLKKPGDYVWQRLQRIRMPWDLREQPTRCLLRRLDLPPPSGLREHKKKEEQRESARQRERVF